MAQLTISMPCSYCRKPVSKLGPHVQETTGVMAHVVCFLALKIEEAKQAGRDEVVREQLERAVREREEQERAARRAFDQLPRCMRCGTRYCPTEIPVQWSQWGEVRPESSTRGVCATCIRDEVRARANARQVAPPTTPAQAIQQAPSAPKTVEQEQGERVRPIEID